ncbi:MAG: hypothetical protein RL038_233 [Actinomycetota bacterium]
MTKQALTRVWLGPVLFVATFFAAFVISRYQAWAAAPAPAVTWGCGAANVMPAGVHLPEKAAFNWGLLAAQVLLAVLVVVLAALLYFGLQIVAAIGHRFITCKSAIFKTPNKFSFNKLVFKSEFVITNFGMRAPPVVFG